MPVLCSSPHDLSRSKSRTYTAGMPTGKRGLGGHELVEQLKAAVAEVIRENRRLKRQVEKISARGTSRSGSAVGRGSRGKPMRVKKASPTTKRRPRRGTAANATKKKTKKTTRKRRAA